MTTPIAATATAASAAAFAALLALGVPTPSAAQPSFACTGTLNPTETVICADPGLAALDRRLTAAYRQRLDSLTPDERGPVVAAQQNWLAERDSCGTNLFCLRNAYLVRISRLGTAAAPPSPAQTPAASLSPNDAACLLLFKNRCPDFAGQPNFVGLCYNRNPQIFAGIPANCNSTFQRQIDQTIPADPAAARANSPHLPDPGRSLGGAARSGPGTNYAKAASLADGTPITILQDTGLTMDGYTWFRVSWSAGTGYEWGGIMCSEDFKLNGIFQICGQPLK